MVWPMVVNVVVVFVQLYKTNRFRLASDRLVYYRHPKNRRRNQGTEFRQIANVGIIQVFNSVRFSITITKNQQNLFFKPYFHTTKMTSKTTTDLVSGEMLCGSFENFDFGAISGGPKSNFSHFVQKIELWDPEIWPKIKIFKIPAQRF